ncbi:membrane protein [Bacteroidota bacterium]|nr:membrane protein [Bacteroidota bacterium]
MRIYRASISIIFLAIFSVAFTSCISTRKIPSGKYLLNSNKIILKDKVDWKKIKKNIENNNSLSSSLLLFAKQKPNKTTLGLFKLNLWVYNIFHTKKLKGLSYWMQSHIGEAPVIFDSMMLFYSSNLMEEYLHTKGYLDATVSGHYKINGRKASAYYDVHADTLYTIDTIEYVKGNQTVTSLMMESSKNTVIKVGSPLDFEKMEEERKRIKKDLQNRGLYRFSADEIYYVVDTPIINHGAHVSVHIDENDSSGVQQPYYIRHVFINQSYNPIVTDSIHAIDTIEYKNLKFISEKNVLNPRRLYRVVFITPGESYSIKKNDFTIHRISDLGTYKFISVQYQQVGKDSLDCNIRLTPFKVSSISPEIKAANIENNLGNSLSLTYLNRNLSKDATRLSFNAIGGVEFPVAKIDSLLFNASSSLSFSVPRVLFPVLYKKVSRYSEQRTNISFTTSALFQTGIYSLYNQNFSFGYDFREPVKELKRHQPGISLTYTRPIIQSDSFRARLNSDFLLKQTFSDQLITGCNYTFTYSNQDYEKLKNFFVMRTGFELAGGILWVLNDGSHLVKFSRDTTTNQALILNIPYSNFLRLEFDYKYYWQFSKYRNLVAHFFSGIGLPFSNSSVLPYIRQFSVGGPNDIRAWRIRSLGPGSSASSQSNGFYNQTGDIKLEGNLEYRFHIIGVLKGALFTDAGNIWMLKKNPENEGANFDAARFYTEIAIGAGAGLRLDFSYFIFRGDIAMPLRNPTLPETERWVFNKIDFANSLWRKNNLILNIAIGYPF